VLAQMGQEQLDLVLVDSRGGQQCRYIGISGQPTCPMPSAVRHRASCGAECPAFLALPAHLVQPSLCASGFTRV
jgi:hypothetical protein